MHHRKSQVFWFAGGLILLVMGATLWLLTAQPSEAQCGSQASSCKNCHEVQAQAPVNNDGTSWHEAHAFGDFCYICHGGNQQATDELAAHEGMDHPLANVNASCQQCHPSDLDERAKVYADALGFEPTNGGDADQSSIIEASTTDDTTAAGDPPAMAAVTAPLTTTMSIDDPNLVDYAQRYDEIVLGKRSVNWGNIILIVLIELVVVGGGAFIVLNEVRRNTLRGQTQKVEGEYPEDVVEMLPAIAGLKTQTRRTLKKILANPQIDKVLGLLDAIASHDKPEGDA